MLFAFTALALVFAYTAVSAPLPASSSRKSSSTDTHRHRHRTSRTSSYSSATSTSSRTFATAVVNTATLRPSVNSTASSSSKYRTSSSINHSATNHSATATSTASSTTATLSTSNATTGWSLSGAQKNGVYIGWLPDDGSGGGKSQTQAEINSAMGVPGAAQGWYAQAQSGVAFKGEQLLWRLNDVVASGGVFQPAIMPTGGWKGLTADDNSQAINIANVLKKFTDQGVEVWLRFAHEVNWYQTDGTYEGDENDFKAGWAAVSAAVKKICPTVKMWYTPNVENLAAYQKYFPNDPATVDLIGIDWYPSDPNADFVSGVQAFHDQYTSETIKFAQGETGLAQQGTLAERLQWLATCTSKATVSALPNLISVSWFNYWKGYEFRIANIAGDSSTIKFLS